MAHNARKLLHDIQEAGMAIKQFMDGKGLDDYQSDDMLSSAVERKFEIIGEALNRLKRIDEELVERIHEYRKVVGFRNILAHGYDALSDEIVWEICQEPLRQQLDDVDLLQRESR